MRQTVTITALLLGLCLASPALGQAPGAPPAPAETQPSRSDPLGRDTPRGTVLGFVKAVEGGQLDRAAEYLDVRKIRKGEVEQRVLQLRAVLDRRLGAVDLERLIAKPEGSLDDGLPPNMDRVGTIENGRDTFDILVERVDSPGEPPVWLFSATTLAGIPAVYEKIRPRWIDRYVWPLMRGTPYFGVALWQWVLLPVGIAAALGLAWLLSRWLFVVVRRVLFRLTGELADAGLATIIAPVRLVTASAILAAGFSMAPFPLIVRYNATRAVLTLGIVGLAWLVLRLSDTASGLVEAHLRRLNQTGTIALAQLVRRLSKVVVVAIAGLSLLHLGGFELTAALAGLGIGGIALAFAAQKTLESFFGGILIISDQPVRVGDFCRVGSILGTVEEIGLRSTRIRTLDRTVVSVPNGQMAAESLENFGVRDKIWFRPSIGVRYETTADQLRYVLAEVRRMLYAHPMVETASARIRFVRFGGSSLDLDVFAYVLTNDYARFLEVQEDILLRIMDIIDAAGTGIAFPSSTTYLAQDSGLDGAKTKAAMAVVRQWREGQDLPFPNFHPKQIRDMENKIAYPAPDSAAGHADGVQGQEMRSAP